MGSYTDYFIGIVLQITNVNYGVAHEGIVNNVVQCLVIFRTQALSMNFTTPEVEYKNNMT
jgi:hypothetical protein